MTKKTTRTSKGKKTTPRTTVKKEDLKSKKESAKSKNKIEDEKVDCPPSVKEVDPSGLTEQEFDGSFTFDVDDSSSNNDQAESDYEVGYKKPPRSRQFKKGQSGNPTGRPKGARNMKSIIYEIGNQTVDVNIDGTLQHMSLAEATIKRAWYKAVKEGKTDLLRFLQENYDKEVEKTQKKPIEQARHDAVMARFMACCMMSLTPWQYMAELTDDDIEDGLNGIKIIANFSEFVN
ncbi:DUF5681 domain-containing protein [Micavibrio aeruginosavorus]|uniref:DUF5681 domain-containing protein n=1 Tax=Micavibrio aeruginosavorus EPB TaxID=349215 RepID=M4VGS1_9BACT|nr:DUF5681 domain-containing protein [Micavibrio aeruginosavorus]AGH97680.1 hypothetical protein A11S_857 [Micavibrio aeruginosavorus EPB]